MDYEDRLKEVLGETCPQCGAVLRQTTRLTKTSGGKRTETEILKCDYCGYKEIA